MVEAIRRLNLLQPAGVLEHGQFVVNQDVFNLIVDANLPGVKVHKDNDVPVAVILSGDSLGIISEDITPKQIEAMGTTGEPWTALATNYQMTTAEAHAIAQKKLAGM